MEEMFTTDLDLVGGIFEVIPSAVIAVDDDVKIIAANSAARRFLAIEKVPATATRAGEVLGCINARDKGCGQGEFCKDCVIRNSVTQILESKDNVLRRKTRVKISRDGGVIIANLLVSVSYLRHGERNLAVVMLEDISELIQLSRLVPICANCKKIRDEGGKWQILETFISERVDVDFSHALCPDCMNRLYHDLDENKVA